MGESPCTCDDPDIVTVKDRNMEPSYIAGNPYSRFCKNCGRRYFCKASFWSGDDEKHIIPGNEEEPVSIEEYNDEYGNFFECPECGEPHFGEPDECGCGAVYQWE